jgi:hypothetical protein
MRSTSALDVLFPLVRPLRPLFASLTETYRDEKPARLGITISPVRGRLWREAVLAWLHAAENDPLPEVRFA